MRSYTRVILTLHLFTLRLFFSCVMNSVKSRRWFEQSDQRTEKHFTVCFSLQTYSLFCVFYTLHFSLFKKENIISCFFFHAHDRYSTPEMMSNNDNKNQNDISSPRQRTEPLGVVIGCLNLSATAPSYSDNS
jgi:hypothetical protein